MELIGFGIFIIVALSQHGLAWMHDELIKH
jgi:hypothetical protein